MKRFKKVLKWTGIVLLVLIGGISATVAMRQNVKYVRPYPAIRASADSAVILRGKNIVFGAAHCADCHSPYNTDSMFAAGQQVSLSGGHAFKLPIGTIYAKNITPDDETGIGRYTDAEIARALRYGVRPDGTVLFDFMPFHNMSDEDLGAVISYLRSQQPVKNAVPDNELNVLGKAVKALLIKPAGPSGEVPVSVKPDTSALYGAYLANSIANCKGCHTPRNMMTGAFEGEPYSGGMKIEGFITPNLTTDSSSRMFGWNRKMFIDRIRMGKLNPKSPMPWNSYKRMSDEELAAIYNYLQTIKPVKTVQP